ncbi:type IV pilin protein [Chromatium okenii]
MTGTTLLELMITLSIAAILMSIAVPSFQPSRAPIASLRSPINSAVHCNSHVRKQ